MVGCIHEWGCKSQYQNPGRKHKDVRTNEFPAILLNVVQVTGVPGHRIAVSGGVNAATAKFLSFFVCEVPTITLVKYTICIHATRPNRENISLETSPVIVDVE